MPGSGKSTLGRNLAPKINLPLIDLDQKIEEKEGSPITEIFAEQGQAYFRQLEHECLVTEIKKPMDAILATGGGAPCFYDNMRLMNDAGITLFIHVGLDDLVRRLSKDKHRPLVNAMDTESLEKGIREKMEARDKFYEQATLTIRNSERFDKPEMANRAFRMIQEYLDNN